MSDRSSSSPLLLAGEPDPVHASCRIGEFVVTGYSQRSPIKATPNEDSALAIAYGDEGIVLAVADGAGGLPAGQRASQTAIQSVKASLDEAAGNDVLMRTALLNAIEAANQAVIDLSNGSATTLTVVGIRGDTLRCCHVGDSPAVLVGQRGRIKFQTIAHSPTGFAVEAGFLDELEAMLHEERHVVSNFLGNNDMRIEVGAPFQLAPKDTLILASDGLTDNLHVIEIVETIRKGNLETAAEKLVAKVRKRMLEGDVGLPSKPDDLTVLLLRRAPRPRKTPVRMAEKPSGDEDSPPAG